MRVLLVALLLVGCHHDDPPIDFGPSVDFDAGVVGGGEAVSAGCLDLEDCVETCLTQEDQSCVSSCTQGSQQLAIDLFNAAVTCAEKYCEGSDADLPYRCTIVDGAPAESDGTAPDPAKPCGQCLGDAQSILSRRPCSSTNSPDCSSTQGSAAGSACSIAETRCVND